MSDYKDDVQIDIDSLDWEWLRQPSLYMKYAEKEAEKNKEVKQIKQQIEVRRAKLCRDILAANEKKPTDKVIESMIFEDAEYISLLDELNTANYEADILSSAVSALNQKKSALENLVKLWAGQYFAGPREPRDTANIPSIKDQALEAADKRQRQALNRKNKKGDD